MFFSKLNKVQNFQYFLITFLFLTNSIFSQDNSDEILAKVGDLVITKSEFENRLYFTPHQGIEDKNSTDGIKKELLYTLIAEKLWANEALKTGMDTLSSVITAKSVIEKMFVRDELYKVEVTDKINFTSEELNEAQERFLKDLDVYVFFTTIEKEAIELKKLIRNNNINNVLSKIDTSKVQFKKMNIAFGDLAKSTEDILYKLNINEFSKPIKMETGWNVFYLNNFIQKENNAVNDIQDGTKKILKILSERKEQTNYDKFHKEFFTNKKIDADGKTFNLIVDELTKIFSSKIKEGNTFVDKTEKEKIIFDSYDLKLFEKEIGLNKLEKDFLIFSPNPIKLLSFMNELSFSSFIVPASNLDSIKIKLHLFLKDYIKYELLAREGYNRGLENSQNVTEWVKIWYENFLFQAIKNEYFNNSNKLLNYSEIKDYIAEEKTNTIEGEEIFNKFISSTIELSDKFKYKINEKLFSQIEQGNINLFVIHNLGFGGSIPAVPSSPPFIEWQIEKEKRISKNSN